MPRRRQWLSWIFGFQTLLIARDVSSLVGRSAWTGGGKGPRCRDRRMANLCAWRSYRIIQTGLTTTAYMYRLVSRVVYIIIIFIITLHRCVCLILKNTISRNSKLFLENFELLTERIIVNGVCFVSVFSSHTNRRLAFKKKSWSLETFSQNVSVKDIL